MLLCVTSVLLYLYLLEDLFGEGGKTKILNLVAYNKNMKIILSDKDTYKY